MQSKLNLGKIPNIHPKLSVIPRIHPTLYKFQIYTHSQKKIPNIHPNASSKLYDIIKMLLKSHNLVIQNSKRSFSLHRLSPFLPFSLHRH